MLARVGGSALELSYGNNSEEEVMV